uniref:Putative secreted protein n=1 Tax=Ixodes ricinus TaxID=34613 RepID=A0A6B0UAJ4_IXORI
MQTCSTPTQMTLAFCVASLSVVSLCFAASRRVLSSEQSVDLVLFVLPRRAERKLAFLFAKQCAAVNTYCLLIKTPPQRNLSFLV